ncbi:hypothetical protein ACSF83_03560 [Lactobacillus johnsonii]|uniref:hypothetical protein n=1 Tax=Lactobacillus johnsonii TaxID=33959 RepID=UPI00261B73F8
MWQNLKKNHIWLILALETYGLAIYFILKHSTGIFMPPGSVLDFLDDPPFILALGIAGTLALIYALWDVHHLFYKPLMTGVLSFVWLMFFGAFLFQDWRNGVLGPQSLLASSVLLTMLGEILVRRG